LKTIEVKLELPELVFNHLNSDGKILKTCQQLLYDALHSILEQEDKELAALLEYTLKHPIK